MATVKEINYSIMYGDLSSDELNSVLQALKFARANLARTRARTLTPGQQVTFNGRNGPVVGRLEKIKIKKAIVVSGQTRWNVPLAMLEGV